MTIEKVSLANKLSTFASYWDPKIVGELNGQHVKLVKFYGPFVWHYHEKEDELFFVLKGSLDMQFRDQTVTVNEGEFIIVPRKVEHKPMAEREVHVLLFEPGTTLNTGNIRDERTIEKPEKI